MPVTEDAPRCRDILAFDWTLRAAGVKINENQKRALCKIKSSDDPKLQLQYIAAQLFLKGNLSTEEEYLLGLCLSWIINLIRPQIKKLYTYVNLQLSNNVHDFYCGLSTSEKALFNDISNSLDVQEALTKVIQKKLLLTEKKDVNCKEYVLLSRILKVLDDIGLWHEEEDEQEITYYRRAASLLEILFENTKKVLVEYV